MGIPGRKPIHGEIPESGGLMRSLDSEVANMGIFVISQLYVFWVNYNDLTATSLEIIVSKGIIPKWP